MKQKTIKKVLAKKLDEWANSVTDDSVRSAIKRDAIVTGGSIASMLLDEKVNDFDIYFRTLDTAKIVSDYYVKKSNAKIQILDGRQILPESVQDKLFYNGEEVDDNSVYTTALKAVAGKSRILLFNPSGYYAVEGRSKGIDSVIDEESTESVDLYTRVSEINKEELPPYSSLYFTANAITLTDQIQLVIRFVGEAQDLHKNYDFVHATSYYDYKEDELVVPYEALESLRTKELKYIGSLYPVTSVIRTKKFIKRGWSCSAGTYLKILFQVSELNLQDVDVLTEQLCGVDIAYFSIIIEALSNRKRESENSVPYEYLSALIDKVFG